METMEMEADRISLLPEDILVQMLSYLPTKFAIQTSILSKRWKSLWILTPNLQFIIDSNSLTPTLSLQQNHIKNINQCLHHLDLLNPNNKLQKLVIALCITHKQILNSDIERWIAFAVARGTKELVLHFVLPYSMWSKGEYIVLPHCLYSCHSFSDLKLSFCKIDIPVSFNGFSNLKLLELNSAKVTDQTVENLIFECPLLEELALVLCHELKQLNISDRNLRLKIVSIIRCYQLSKVVIVPSGIRVFRYVGPFVNFGLIKLPHLEEVAIQFDGEAVEIVTMHRMRQTVYIISQVKVLSVGNWFSQFIFSEYYTGRGQHILFENLKKFSWSGDLHSEKEVLSIATFLGDCPVLEQLCIKLENERHSWSRHHIPETRTKYPRHLDFPLKRLKLIRMIGYSGEKKEINLVKFLLKKSMVLETFLLTSSAEKSKGVPNYVLQEDLYQLPKASLNATVILSEPVIDDFQGEAWWF